MIIESLKGNGHSRQTSPGFGETYEELNSNSKSAFDDFQKSFSREWKQRTQSELYEILRECSRKNWDGYDADPVTPESFHLANKFLSCLPEDVNPPEVIPEPDGYISFDWENEDSSFSVSAHEQLLIFAGIFEDTNKHHGEEKFINQIPDIISFFLTKYFRRLL